jgi:hypothetical protein
VYVADGGDTIWKINPATSEVTAFAGSPAERSVTDGDSSTARFGTFSDLTSDGLNLYVQDGGLRKLSIATRQVTTLSRGAGGPMWIDGVSLYYSVSAPTGGGEIRKLNLATGQDAVFAGRLASSSLSPVDAVGVDARFARPQAIWRDGEFLFVSDAVLQRCVGPGLVSCVIPTVIRGIIRKIAMVTGEVTTLSFADPIPASVRSVWGDGTYLYLPSRDSIIRISIATGVETPLRGTIQFTGPMPSSSSYSIAPRSSFRLRTPGTAETINVGTVRITPDPGSVAPSGLVVFSFRSRGVTVSETGVPAVPPAQAFRSYVENSGRWGTTSSLQTGLAISNAAESPALVKLELFTMQGQPFGNAGYVTVPAKGHIPLFLSEVPEFQKLTAGFQGLVRVSTDAPSGISVIALRARYNERGDFLVATMPVVNEAAPPSSVPMMFPHFATGGGYTTQFVLFSGTAAQSTSGSIRFFSQAGQELQMRLR